MANFWTIFRRKTDNAQTPQRKSVLQLTADEKSAIEDDKNSGMSAKDSAEGLNLDVATVYAYRKSMQAQANKPIIQTPEQQRQAVKDDLAIQKLKIESEAVIQTMQLERMKFAKEMAEWKADMEEQYGAVDTDNMSIEDMISLLSSIPQQGAPAHTPIQNTPPQGPSGAPAPSPEGANAPLETIPQVEMTDEQICAIIESYDKKQRKMAKLLPDQLIFDKIAEQLPTLSDKTINRAIELLREKY